MWDWKNWVGWIDASLLPFIPPSLIGAFIGAAYAKDQTDRQRAASFVISAGFSVYATAAIAENLHWGPATLAIVAILGAVIGTDIVGGIKAAGRSWKVDPFGTAGRLWSMIRPGGYQPPPPADLPPQGGGDPLRRDS